MEQRSSFSSLRVVFSTREAYFIAPCNKASGDDTHLDSRSDVEHIRSVDPLFTKLHRTPFAQDRRLKTLSPARRGLDEVVDRPDQRDLEVEVSAVNVPSESNTLIHDALPPVEISR
jgi:hypothetical protein